MQWLIDTVYSNTLWFYTVVYKSNFFYFDLWTINHIWSGSVIYLLLSVYRIKNKWIILFAILLGYELIEILFRIFALNLFKPEIIKDQINDVLFGLLGALLSHSILKWRKGKSRQVFLLRYPFTSIFTAGTVAFLWVGFYGYKYNEYEFNTPGLNVFAFIVWWLSLYGIIQLYELFGTKMKRDFPRALTVWLIYFPLLLIIEYISYYIFELRESGNHFSREALMFGVIHGTPILHTFYLLFPFVVITVYKLFKKLVDKATTTH